LVVVIVIRSRPSPGPAGFPAWCAATGYRRAARTRSSPDSTGEGRRDASACSCSAAMPGSTKQHSRTTSNRGLKRFEYPVVVRGFNPVEIEANDSKVLEDADPKSEHWRGLQLDPNHRLLIRRSLVRAQVEEPIESKGYVVIRDPFLFAILDSGSTSCARSLLPIATPRPSSGPSTERREPASRRAPPQMRQELCPLAGGAPKVKHSPPPQAVSHSSAKQTLSLLNPTQWTQRSSRATPASRESVLLRAAT
jgi:hypothetical protein